MISAFGVCHDFDVSKGRYSDTMEVVQEHRRKANRRHATGDALLAGGLVAGTTAAANTEGAKSVGRWAGDRMIQRGNKEFWRSLANADGMNRRAGAATKLTRLGETVRSKPGAAVAGVIGGTLAAGAGVTAAGMAHNARANQLAREYNRKKLNSKIRIAPITGKNRV